MAYGNGTMRTVLFTALAGIVWYFSPASARACELMAFSFNQEAPAQQLFDAFRRHGAVNVDGWGLAYYRGQSAVLFKEPENGATSRLAEFLTTYGSLRSKLMIAHVRKATVGVPAQENTHPFVREVNGREYVLAHNGTLKNYAEKLKLSRIKPLGVSDSEHLMCYLVGRIEDRRVGQWDASACEWLEKELAAINEMGELNCVFSDGEHLFAYYDKHSFNSLNYVVRRAPYGKARFPDLSQTVDLAKVYPESAAGVVVATKPLTDEKWTAFLPGQLMVFKDGERVYPKGSGK